jgi:hypothetical protein
MPWKSLFVRERREQEAAEHSPLEPWDLLQTHRARLNALRLESGYDAEQFERLIGAALLRTAEWVHLVPATRAENHSESGGLLRFAIETACLAFRRADGKFLSSVDASDVRNRERERVRRYVALLGGLFRPVGRCATHLKVTSADGSSTWNPLQESLWQWHCRAAAHRIELHWREGVDARPTLPASTWIAARVLPSGALGYLQSADDSLPELLLRAVNADRTGRVCEIVEEAYQAAIDQDIARRGSVEGTTQADVQVEHRLLEALRALCREKWTMNTPGSRLWCTEQGVFLVWRAAANDVLVRLRAQGITGVPSDPDTLAELLMGHGVLAPNPNVTAGLKHYFRILPQLRGLPKHWLEVVKVADTELIGLQLQGVDRLPAEVLGSGSSNASASVELKPERAPEQLLLEPQAPMGATSETSVSEPPPLPPPKKAQPGAGERDAAFLADRFKRFGAPGLVLQKLADQLLNAPQSVAVARVPDGVAIGFPEAISALGSQPQEFLAACETQGLLVPEKTGGRRFVRSRASDQKHLPPQYIVLTPRIARHLPIPNGERT